MNGRHAVTRRHFLKGGVGATALGILSLSRVSEAASRKMGKYATLIDLTKCDGCQNEPIPKCVEACRRLNENKFPNPKQPIKNLWPQRTYDDWSKKRDVTDTLTPYNWIMVQHIEVEGERIYIPRRCMHCDNPPCANLCPFGALNKYDDGAVVINHGLCLGGAKCKAVCPWQIPQRQSGVGLYLKLQPIPAGGGVMYKCDLCHDRLKEGLLPACVEACRKRLGDKSPLYFGPRAEVTAMAHARAQEIGGFLYGETENGGTGTFYVSRIPFEKINSKLQVAKISLHFAKVRSSLDDVNAWAKGFLIGPTVAFLGAIGLIFFGGPRRKGEKGKGDGKDSER